MDKEDPAKNQTKDGLLLVKGRPFAGLSENFAPSKLFQTSSPTMSHCCELICHINLMQQNVNSLQFILANSQGFAGDYLHGGKSFRHIYTPSCLHPDWPGSFLADGSVCSQECDWMSIQEFGCNQVCDNSMGFAASGFRSGIGAFLGPV